MMADFTHLSCCIRTARAFTTAHEMPELPEVETSRAHVEKFCLGSTISKCNAMEQGGGPRDGQFDDLVIGEDVTAKSLKSTLEGRTVVALKRRGKQMWFVLDKPPHPLFHFGMTGAFTIKGEKRYKFVKFKVGEGWPPRFTKLELQMSNGVCLALTDPRRLARVRLRMEPEAQPPISSLGPDPLTHPICLEAFAAALAKPTAPIKAVLLAQDRVVSGVGNWVADEVCFQACVHPGAACNTLAPEQVAALHTKLMSVCHQACEARADYTIFPQEWLFHHRWGKGKSAEGAPRVSSGHPIHFDVVGGRTTAIVPAVQRKGLLKSPGGLSASSKETAAAKGRKGKAGRRDENIVKKEEETKSARDTVSQQTPIGNATKRGRGKTGGKDGKDDDSTFLALANGKKTTNIKNSSVSNKATSTKVKAEPVKKAKAAGGREKPALKPSLKALPKGLPKAATGSGKTNEASATAASGGRKRTRGGTDEMATTAKATGGNKSARRANAVNPVTAGAVAGATIGGTSAKRVAVCRRSARLAK